MVLYFHVKCCLQLLTFEFSKMLFFQVCQERFDQLGGCQMLCSESFHWAPHLSRIRIVQKVDNMKIESKVIP